MATTADIRNGLCIEFNNDLFSIVQFQHVKPGKGPAFVRTKMKSLTTGRVIDNTFSSGHKIDVVRIERRPYQYLYKDISGQVFMHRETYEQVSVEEKIIDNFDLFSEGQEVDIMFHAEKELPLEVILPPFVIAEVTYTEPGLRGDTSSTNSLKAATISTGAIVQVPLFINQGDKIKIDTRDRSYSERVK
ncbi:MAG TPA: elongation factor P [Bacteroidales bacterium]|nr:elongation factor P [Bacteroidales bacterium]